jgi:hypothetical protein
MGRILLVILLFITLPALSQRLSKSEFSALKKMEESMKVHANKMIMDPVASTRFSSDSMFTRLLVQALQTKNSFYYTFDSILTVSQIYAPDSTFRIFTWQFTRDENFYRQRGAIQMRTDDGSLKLTPLFDVSDYTNAPADSVRTNKNWIGAIYYGIVQKSFNNKNYYTLIGFDDNSVRSTKKWIEVLTFDEDGNPRFGGPFFSILSDSARGPHIQPRFEIEYKKDGRARMNYDRELDLIIYDHLISQDNEPEKKYTLIPDGDYQGFKWTDGRWLQIDKVFDFKLKDGEFPMPAPLKDDEGKSNEEWLKQQSEKNSQKGKTKGKGKD